MSGPESDSGSVFGIGAGSGTSAEPHEVRQQLGDGGSDSNLRTSVGVLKLSPPWLLPRCFLHGTIYSWHGLSGRGGVLATGIRYPRCFMLACIMSCHVMSCHVVSCRQVASALRATGRDNSDCTPVVFEHTDASLHVRSPSRGLPKGRRHRRVRESCTVCHARRNGVA